MSFPLDPDEVAICGHRGAPHQRPENTLGAIEAAIELGAELVEFDVRLAACGTPVVFHDRDLERMAGRPERLDALTAAELQRLDLGHDQHVPSLDEVIDACRGRVGLAVEIKELRAVEPTVRCLERHGVARDVLVMSFLFDAVKALGSRGAGLHAGMLMGRETLDPVVRLREALPIFDVKRCGASFLSIHHLLHHAGLASLCRRLQIPVATWTVNRADAIQRMLGLGVQMIITDYPELARTLRQRAAPNEEGARRL